MRVAIIGGLAKEPNGALRYGEEWEIWGLNAIHPSWADDGKWSRWFNLHRYAHLLRDWRAQLEDEMLWARQHPWVPYYVVDSWKDQIPREVIFPRKELRYMPRTDYHAGSFDWMVAYAVHLGSREIALHGVGLNMESGEPISARACLEYWCGYAAGRGCEVTVKKDCDIFAQYHLVKSNTVYGWDDVKLVENRA